MMRNDLPPDCHRSLDYRSTIDMLSSLEGEEVCLFISGGAGVIAGDGEAASRIQAKGILRHYAYGRWTEGFALGDAARVLLYEPDFFSAEMRTLDGVDLFWISVKLTELEFSIGNLETDEFDRFP
jgi:hypothetical protein